MVPPIFALLNDTILTHFQLLVFSLFSHLSDCDGNNQSVMSHALSSRESWPISIFFKPSSHYHHSSSHSVNTYTNDATPTHIFITTQKVNRKCLPFSPNRTNHTSVPPSFYGLDACFSLPSWRGWQKHLSIDWYSNIRLMMKMIKFK